MNKKPESNENAKPLHAAENVEKKPRAEKKVEIEPNTATLPISSSDTSFELNPPKVSTRIISEKIRGLCDFFEGNIVTARNSKEHPSSHQITVTNNKP